MNGICVKIKELVFSFCLFVCLKPETLHTVDSSLGSGSFLRRMNRYTFDSQICVHLNETGT